MAEEVEKFKEDMYIYINNIKIYRDYQFFKKYFYNFRNNIANLREKLKVYMVK